MKRMQHCSPKRRQLFTRREGVTPRSFVFWSTLLQSLRFERHSSWFHRKQSHVDKPIKSVTVILSQRWRHFKEKLLTSVCLSACNNLWFLQGRTKGQVNRQASGSAELQETIWRHWNIRKYGAGNIRFPHAKEFLRKWSAIWARAFKDLRQPCARPKILRISVGQHHIYWSRNRLHVSPV
jgi:hypothetical protein